MCCIRCKQPKVVGEFDETPRNVLKRMHTCKECRKLQTFGQLTVLDGYLKHVTSVHRHLCKARGIPFDLDWAYLRMLHTRQQGKCLYTGTEMRTVRGQGHSKLAMSLDRVIPERGYVKGNVALVTKRANLIKNDQTLDELRRWMPSWYRRLEESGYVYTNVT